MVTAKRPSLTEVYMRFAQDLARRSTCVRARVGAIVTTPDLQQVLAIGYNGNAKGFPNRCDSDEPGSCGCLHAEVNALVKCGKVRPDKVLFTTLSPCVMCAKLIVNSGFSLVYYQATYRKPDGLKILRDAGIVTEEL